MGTGRQDCEISLGTSGFFRMYYSGDGRTMALQISVFACSCVVAFTLTGCSAPPTVDSRPITSTGIICDRFEPQAVLEEDQLVLSLDTDLPDQTILMVSVSRSYHAGSPEDEFPLNYMSVRSTVGEWRAPHKVSVAHSAWAKLLDERARVSAITGERLNVKRTNRDIEASFTVPIGQSDPRFRENNANLSGAKVSSAGLRVVRAEKSVAYPLSIKGAVPAHQYAPREALQRGVTYQIPKEVPLMPNRTPTNPLEDLQHVRRLPPQTRVTVLTVDRSQASNPWYRVRAVSPKGDDFGSGWINSLALIGSDIVQVQP